MPGEVTGTMRWVGSTGKRLPESRKFQDEWEWGLNRERRVVWSGGRDPRRGLAGGWLKTAPVFVGGAK